MKVFRQLLAANEEYRRAFDKGNLLPPPLKQLAVLTCMDCRIDTASVFGLDPGDAHVLRNAGARVSDDAVRSLIVSTAKLGVRRIAVVHHTHCGAASMTEPELREAVVERTGHDPGEIDFLLFADPEHALQADIERLCTCPFLPEGTLVGGFMYDVETGVLSPSTPVYRIGDNEPEAPLPWTRGRHERDDGGPAQPGPM